MGIGSAGYYPALYAACARSLFRPPLAGIFNFITSRMAAAPGKEVAAWYVKGLVPVRPACRCWSFSSPNSPRTGCLLPIKPQGKDNDSKSARQTDEQEFHRGSSKEPQYEVYYLMSCTARISICFGHCSSFSSRDNPNSLSEVGVTDGRTKRCFMASASIIFGARLYFVLKSLHYSKRWRPANVVRLTYTDGNGIGRI